MSKSVQPPALVSEKILVTGAAGQIGLPLCEFLAGSNEVHGLARFRAAGSMEAVEAAGARPLRVDLAAGDYDGVPDDFTYVIHLAAYIGPNPDFDRAIRNNAESVAFLLRHCRRAKAALVMSTHSVYRPHADAMHAYSEVDPLGETNSFFAPTYSVSKICEEAVARTCARLFDLPVTIARMNASYGPNGGLVSYDTDAIVAGRPVQTRSDPSWYSPIHQDDINAQTAALLAAASVPATVVNWAGDEAVSVQQWCGLAAELCGLAAQVDVVDLAGTPAGAIADVTKRRSITGPCAVPWQEGIRATVLARHGELASSVPSAPPAPAD